MNNFGSSYKERFDNFAGLVNSGRFSQWGYPAGSDEAFLNQQIWDRGINIELPQPESKVIYDMTKLALSQLEGLNNVQSLYAVNRLSTNAIDKISKYLDDHNFDINAMNSTANLIRILHQGVPFDFNRFASFHNYDMSAALLEAILGNLPIFNEISGLKDAAKEYFGIHDFSTNSLEIAINLFSINGTNTQFPKLDPTLFVAGRTPRTRGVNRNRILDFYYTDKATNSGFAGIEVILSVLGKYPKYNRLVGTFMRTTLSANNINIPLGVPNEFIAEYLEILPPSVRSREGIPNPNMRIFFKNNFGKLAYDLGLTTQQKILEHVGKVVSLSQLLGLDGNASRFLLQRPTYTSQLLQFFQQNGNDDKTRAFAFESMRVTAGGTQIQKRVINATLNGNPQIAFDAMLEGSTPHPQNLCCPDEPPFDPVVAFVAVTMVDFLDASYNAIVDIIERGLSDETKGRRVRSLFEKSGLVIPDDVDNATLGVLFKIRKRGRELTVEPLLDWKGELLDAGITMLDLFGVLSPSKGAGAYLFIKGGQTTAQVTLTKYLKTISNIAKTTLKGGRGYTSFSIFKKTEGLAKPGNELHHIVEQNGFKGLNALKFGKSNLHNTKNIVEIPTGKGTLHNAVTSHFQRKFPFTKGKTVREWLSTQSFQQQYDYGIKVLRDNGWTGTIK